MKRFRVTKSQVIYYSIDVEVEDNEDRWDAAEKADEFDGGLWEENGFTDWENESVEDLETGEVWMF